jgi:hypothetical protein
MIIEFKRIWKEAVVAYFKVLSRPGSTEENYEKSQYCRYPLRDLKLRPLEYEARVTTTQSRMFFGNVFK